MDRYKLIVWNPLKIYTWTSSGSGDLVAARRASDVAKGFNYMLFAWHGPAQGESENGWYQIAGGVRSNAH